MTRYFKRYWDETTGDELTDAWGTSTYYFETDEELNVIRQIQVFKNGQVLKYHSDFMADDFGMLADQHLDKDEFEEFAIDEKEFTGIWKEMERKVI